MCGFFLQNFRRFYKKFPTLFGEADESEGQDEGGNPDFSDGFNENFGWIYNVKNVAEFEGITLEAAYNLNIMQFFNDLVYLKEKSKHDERLIKNARNPK